jgi:cell wall-associated NlpC family hydrolase
VPSYRRNERTWGGRLLVLVVLTAAFLTLCGSGHASASTAAIDKARAEAQALSDLIDQLSLELEAATEDYNYAGQQFEDTQAAAKKTSAELARAEKDLRSVQSQLNQRLVSMYKSGNLGMLSVVLGANSFSELIGRLGALNRIGEQDAQLAKQIQVYKTQAAARKVELEAALQQQESYRVQTVAAKQKVLDQLAKQSKALKGKEALVAQLKKEEAVRQAKLAAEERARKAFLASRPGKVISLAMQYLGVPYVWGGYSPRGFDCSGLVQYVYAKVGVSLPHSSRMQYGCGTPVSRNQLQAGDLVFYYNPIQHVGIYMGNGRIINATGNQVQISDVFTRGYRGACRVL